VARTNGTLDRPVLTILDHEGRDRMTLRDVALFARRVQAVTGRYPGLYVNRRELAVKDVRQFTGDPATAGVLSQCWLWVADYSRPEPWIIEFPAVWERWTLWQYTGDFEGGVASAIGRPPFDGQVSAGAFRRMGSRVLPDGQRTRRSVDRNLFSGTAAEWEAFHATNATAPATWRWNGAQPVR
jgi:GH25 family lysozyme M1 (1,4-beta-N-acetylmuramidase)